MFRHIGYALLARHPGTSSQWAGLPLPADCSYRGRWIAGFGWDGFRQLFHVCARQFVPRGRRHPHQWEGRGHGGAGRHPGRAGCTPADWQCACGEIQDGVAVRSLLDGQQAGRHVRPVLVSDLTAAALGQVHRSDESLGGGGRFDGVQFDAESVSDTRGNPCQSFSFASSSPNFFLFLSQWIWVPFCG